MSEKQKKEIEKAISENPILGASKDVGAILDDPGFHVESFDAGQVIFSPAQTESEFALIVRGSVRITKSPGGKTVIMKRAEAGAAFGVAGLFGNGGHYASTVTALERRTKVAMLTQDAIERLLRREPDAAVAYIGFLSERIRYLNEKIDSFSEPDSLVQLAAYFLNENEVDGGMQKLAQTLAISRATLYRQTAKLEECGAIEKNGKKILVKNPGILEEIVKGK